MNGRYDFNSDEMGSKEIDRMEDPHNEMGASQIISLHIGESVCGVTFDFETIKLLIDDSILTGG